MKTLIKYFLATCLIAPVSSWSISVSARPVRATLLYSWTGSSTTADTTTAMIGQTYTVPANTLSASGDFLDVYCVAFTTSFSVSKNLYVSLGAVGIGSGATTSTIDGWLLRARAYFDTGTNLIATTFRDAYNDTGGSPTSRGELDRTMAVTSTSNFAVDCNIVGVTGATAAGDEDMTLIHMEVWAYTTP